MTLRTPAPHFASRLVSAGLLAFYAAIALLGSGGLHAIAPGCHSRCCATEPAAAHSHKGCSHHHHAHSHAPASEDRKQSDPPRHCPDGCLICEFAATPAVPVALVIVLPQQGLVETLTPVRETRCTSLVTASFWIRGPPALG